eukprot:3271901-Pyramimonas_sp.AAC.1
MSAARNLSARPALGRHVPSPIGMRVVRGASGQRRAGLTHVRASNASAFLLRAAALHCRLYR